MLARKTTTALAAALLLAAASTTSANAAVTNDEDRSLDAPQGAEARVLVQNDNIRDVEVYAISEDGKRVRLGMVARLTGKTFNLPAWMADGSTQFRLKIYAYESQAAASATRRILTAVKTNPLSASDGEAITLMVGSPLTNSYINH